MKPAIAPTSALAEPRVEGFIRRVMPEVLGEAAQLKRFFSCDPCTNEVRDWEGNRWYEGNWGAVIHAQRFSAMDFAAFSKLSNSIQCGEFEVDAIPGNLLEITLWLHGRVLRF